MNRAAWQACDRGEKKVEGETRERERELTTNTMASVSTCGEHAIKRYKCFLIKCSKHLSDLSGLTISKY